MKYDVECVVQNSTGEMVKIDYGHDLNGLDVIQSVAGILRHPNDEEFWYKLVSFEVRVSDNRLQTSFNQSDIDQFN